MGGTLPKTPLSKLLYLTHCLHYVAGGQKGLLTMFELLRRLPLPPGLGAMDARLGLLRFFLFTAKTLLSNATIYTSKENSQRSCTQITHCMRFNSLLLYALGICGSHIPTQFFFAKGPNEFAEVG